MSKWITLKELVEGKEIWRFMVKKWEMEWRTLIQHLLDNSYNKTNFATTTKKKKCTPQMKYMQFKEDNSKNPQKKDSIFMYEYNEMDPKRQIFFTIH